MIIGELDLKKIGDRLRKVDRYLLDVLSVRLASGGLSDLVAENKRNASLEGIFNKRRQEVENARIENMKKWALEIGIDPNFAAMLMYTLISESCRVQDEIMVKKYERKEIKVDENKAEEVYAYQRKNLLSLTAKVAGIYDEGYAKDFIGTRVYSNFEKEKLYELIANLPDKSLAIDLGCATGIISFEIAPHFSKVIGYDISPEMIAMARGKTTNSSSHVEFVEFNIKEEILPADSVSLAVMNMGTASDIKDIKGVLQQLKNILHPQGKFFLSFYNSQSLLAKIGFIPWPMPLAAHIDSDNRCLEVRCNNEVFFLYARPRSIEEVKNLLSDFKIDAAYSFPTFSSILPNIVLEDEDGDGNRHANKEALKMVKKIDKTLASSDLFSGTYIIVTGGKI
jgi:ubiquinone/menaquinone biosynthesis C-methylase UbiE/chorismate mutase